MSRAGTAGQVQKVTRVGRLLPVFIQKCEGPRARRKDTCYQIARLFLKLQKLRLYGDGAENTDK